MGTLLKCEQAESFCGIARFRGDLVCCAIRTDTHCCIHIFDSNVCSYNHLIFLLTASC